MNDYVIRLQQEKNELADKLNKLRVFIKENVIFQDLPVEEQNLLVNQETVMTQYLNILEKRLELASK